MARIASVWQINDNRIALNDGLTKSSRVLTLREGAEIWPARKLPGLAGGGLVADWKMICTVFAVE